MHLLNEVTEHRFGDFEVRDHAVLHRPNGHDIPRRAPEHPLGLFANSQDIRRARLNRHNRRLSQYNASVPYINEGIGRPQVYPNVVGKQGFELRKHELA